MRGLAASRIARAHSVMARSAATKHARGRGLALDCLVGPLHEVVNSPARTRLNGARAPPSNLRRAGGEQSVVRRRLLGLAFPLIAEQLSAFRGLKAG
jgi:hypothetical protein